MTRNQLVILGAVTYCILKSIFSWTVGFCIRKFKKCNNVLFSYQNQKSNLSWSRFCVPDAWTRELSEKICVDCEKNPRGLGLRLQRAAVRVVRVWSRDGPPWVRCGFWVHNQGKKNRFDSSSSLNRSQTARVRTRQLQLFYLWQISFVNSSRGSIGEFKR